MNGIEKLDRLIGAIYESAMMPQNWSKALALCAEYVGASGAHLLAVEKSSGLIREELFGGIYINRQDFTHWTQCHLPQDPRMTSGMMANIGLHEWRFCHAYLDKRFVARNEIYQDFLIPIGVRYTMGGLIDNTPTSKVMLGFLRTPHQPRFEVAEREAAIRFGYHVSLAYRLYSRNRALHGKAELSSCAINALDSAVFIVDNNAQVLHLNIKAEKLLAYKAGDLIVKFGALSCRVPALASKLSALIAQATQAPALGGVMLLPGIIDTQILLTPISAASELASDWQRPLALVMIRENSPLSPYDWPVNLSNISCQELPGFELGIAQEGSRNRLDCFAKIFRLTQREAEVLQGLLEGYATKEIAKRHDVSWNTVRSQVASLLQKTECRRQKDLIRLFLQGA